MNPNLSKPINRSTATHYSWGGICDGWRLVDNDEMSVIEERVPGGAYEVRHYHKTARQFFYIFKGEAVLEVNGTKHHLAVGDGLEVPPGTPHQFMNHAPAEVVFLVISVPSTKGDRIEVGTMLQ